MKRIAVMQPYLFPYIGYFQLVKAVDKFVFYDDVDFIKNGWINRNRILINEEPKYFTVPCKGISSNKKIKNIKHGLDQRTATKLLKKIKFTYSRAPFFEQTFDIIEEVLSYQTKYISELAIHSVKKCSEYIGLECTFYKSSERYTKKGLNAAERLIDICKKEEVHNYVNPIGGKKLYSKEYFQSHGLSLQFLDPGVCEYSQFSDHFTPWLSILDVMMFNAPDKIKNVLLDKYRLK